MHHKKQNEDVLSLVGCVSGAKGQLKNILCDESRMDLKYLITLLITFDFTHPRMQSSPTRAD